MDKKPVRTVEDFEAFFQAYNDHNWEELFRYVSNDCVWNASEQSMQRPKAMMSYWLDCHKSIKETLGKPQNVIFGDDMAYLQVPITMEFMEDGEFWGKHYSKGAVIHFWCADAYSFAPDGTIKQCRVYTKFD